MATSVKCAFLAVAFWAFWLLSSHSAFAGENLCDTGQIFELTQDSTSQTNWQELQSDLRDVHYIFVGERHGVKEHPEAVTCILSALKDFQIALYLEHIGTDKQPLIETYRNKHPEHSGGLGKILKWWETGWPDWRTYAPIFERSWRLRVPLFAADLPSDNEHFSERNVIAQLGARADEIVSDWSKTMITAHCGLIDEARSKELGLQQVSRDLHMASQLANSAEDKVILFAGRAHVRKDRSVPYILTHANLHHSGSETSMLTIALYEKHLPVGLVKQQEVIQELKDKYDYVWFIGTVNQEDTCTRLKSLGIKKKS